MRDWADAARRFIALREALAAHRFCVVRYEDLVTDPRQVIEQLLDLIGLDLTLYSHADAAMVPVVGSSDLARDSGRVDWMPRQKEQEFDPLSLSAIHLSA